MSQVSYGTITIVDTTDIARIYMVYAKSVSNTTPPSDELTWSESIASAPGEGDFIWQKTVVEKAITEEKTYSDPVCVTGSSGQGIEKIINYYCNYGQGQPEEDYSGWQLEIPEYDESKPNYWTKVVVIYSDDTREDFQASGTIATFENEKIGMLDSLEVSLSPIQDLHGYDKPWVGGAGKNKLPVMCESTTKSGVTYTVYKNNSGAVTRIHAEGTSTSAHSFTVIEGHSASNPFRLKAGSYWFKGMSNGMGGSFDMNIRKVGESTDIVQVTDKVPIVLTEDTDFQSCYLYIYNGKTINTDIYPMVWSQSESNDDFEPYTNICPISGWDEVETHKAGKNLCDNADALLDLGTGVTYSEENGYYFPRHYDTGASHPIFVNEDGLTGQMTLSFKQKQSKTGQVKGYLYFTYTDGTFGKPGIYPSTANTWFGYSITSDPSKVVANIRYGYSSAGGDSWVKDIQVELGSTATAYEPYNGQTYTKEIEATYTPTVQENEPYQFKRTGDVGGDRESIELVGGTVAWNQLYNPSATQSVNDGGLTLTKDAANATWTLNGITTGKGNRFGLGVVNKQNHVYYLTDNTNQPSVNIHLSSQSFGQDRGSGAIIKNTFANKTWYYVFNVQVDVGTEISNLVLRPMVIDFTQLFGSTIADYIYSLEQATEGAGVAWFRNYFPKDYYPYDPGTLRSVEGVSAHETVGFNQWDEEWELGYYNVTTGEPATSSHNLRSKNFIPVIPNTSYYAKIPTGYIAICEYDADKNFIKCTQGIANSGNTTTADTHFIRFHCTSAYGTTYNHDICINLSDPTRNGEYEPYQKHTYPLDSSLTLRGIPKLDASNSLYYDGDTYAYDGTVTRKYVKCDLATFTWITRATGDVNKVVSTSTRAIGEYNPQTVVGISDKYPYVGKSSAAVLINTVNTAEKGFYFYNSGTLDYSLYLVIPKDETPSGSIVFSIATPTTETADPFESIQKVIPNYGTEEFVTDSIVPVGNNTQYYTRDIFGGTLDLVTGVLTVDRAMVDLGTLNWNVYNGKFTSAPNPEPLRKAFGEINMLCSIYKTGNYGSSASQGDGTIWLSASTSSNTLYVEDSRYSDPTAFKQAISGVQLVYELATPTTIQCDPQEVQTLLGRNNVWSGGTVEVRGHTISKRDVMIYKDNGLTDVVDKSAEANTNAAEALDKANNGIVSTTQLWYQTNSTSAPSVPTSHSQVDHGTVTYDNWRSARPNNSVDSYKYYYYCYEYLHGDGTYTYSAEAILDTSNLSQYQIGALTTKVKNFWWDSNGAHVASGKNGNEVTTNTISTYGYHALMGLTGISFNYDSAKVVDLNGEVPSLDFYTPPVIENNLVTANGKLAMRLNKSSLNFYNPEDGETIQASLSTNGLIIQNGSIELGNSNSNIAGSITLSNQNFSRNINNITREDLRFAIGSNFGVKDDGTLYASNVDIEGAINVNDELNSNIYTKEEVNSGLEDAAATATNFIKTSIDGSGIRIAAQNTSAYLLITDKVLRFYLNDNAMSQFGYDEIFESYGVQAENIFIKGAGNALRLDNNVNGTYQGQYILETRANGHLSLKPGLRHTEEE